MTEQQEKYNNYVLDDMENNRGRLVNCCAEMKYMLDNPSVSKIFEKHYLNDIIAHATTHSEFYKEYVGVKSLKDFPIINKTIIKENWDKIVVNEYVDMPDNCMKYTSGSTGTPLKVLLDRYKHCRWIAGNKVFRDNVGVKSHERNVYIGATDKNNDIPKDRQERDNVYYLYWKDFDESAMKELMTYLCDNKIRTFTCNGSTLDAMARAIQSFGGKYDTYGGESIIAIFSVAEALKETTRKVLSEYFSCPVYVLFANEENGVLAVEDGRGNGCLANTADFYFEVLSMDSDEPAKDGEIGRLVITDYFNKAFPIIRYENGDLVIKKTMEDGRLYFTEILGRKNDMLYTTDKKMVHYFDSICFLEEYMDIKQFQLIQEDYYNFRWILNTKNHEYEDIIVSRCKKLFGEDSNWTFEYVDEIPKLKSGKLRVTVCNI